MCQVLVWVLGKPANETKLITQLRSLWKQRKQDLCKHTQGQRREEQRRRSCRVRGPEGRLGVVKEGFIHTVT